MKIIILWNYLEKLFHGNLKPVEERRKERNMQLIAALSPILITIVIFGGVMAYEKYPPIE